MNIIAFRTIRDFYEKHPSMKNGLRTWYTILKAQEWKQPQDAVKTFGAKSVDILNNQRLCIDVKGNHVRIIISMNYKKNTAFIKWVGLHKDYNELGDKVHSVTSIKNNK